MHKREGDVDTVRNLEGESERRVKQERERRKEFHGDSSRVSNRRERRKRVTQGQAERVKREREAQRMLHGYCTVREGDVHSERVRQRERKKSQTRARRPKERVM